MLFFASDFHLGLYKVDKQKHEQKIINFLNHCKKSGAQKIFLVGDIFDFWYEYKFVVPKGYFNFISKIKELVDSKIEVIVFKGNHDVWMFDYLQTECGVKMINGEYRFTYQNKQFYIHHGDGLGPGDFTYKFLRKVFHNKVNQWLFSRLHPNFAMWLGYTWSKKSRLAKKGKVEQYLGDDKEFITQYVQQMHKKFPEIDYYICGHRHLALDKKIGNAQYINLGDMININTYAVFNQGKLQLLHWNE